MTQKKHSISQLLLFLIFFAPLQGSDVNEQPKICLSICVQNDATTIKQCLESAKNIIDYLYICDLGSTDETMEIIADFLHHTHIPATLQTMTFNPSINHKNHLLKTAKSILKQQGFSHPSLYLLTLEPSTVLKIRNSFKKEQLEEEAYLLLEQSFDHSSYQYKLCLMKAYLDCTHCEKFDSKWSCQGIQTGKKLKNILILNQEDDTCKEQKNLEKIKYFSLALEENPNFNHYRFYLAQTYKSLKSYATAIDWFSAFLTHENNPEQRWFAKLQMAECYELDDNWEMSLYWYLDAYQSEPLRSDPLFKVAYHYRNQGLYNLSYIFAKHATKIPENDDQLVYIQPPENDYLFDQELSIISYYTPFKKDGYKAACDLLLNKDLPDSIRNQTIYNLLFYLENIALEKYQPIQFDLPFIDEKYGDQYRPMNPSIIKTEEGYEVICRTVNYTQRGAQFFSTIDKEGVFRTKNFFLQYDKSFHLKSQVEIVENLQREHYIFTKIEGLDDCRLFKMDGNYWFTCTTTDTNPTGSGQISLCQLNLNTRPATVTKLLPLQGPNPYRCEKNWAPFFQQGSLHVIYSWDPFIIYKPSLETGTLQKVLHRETTYNFSSFRGSSSPIEFEDGYLILIHEVFFQLNYDRVYTHRFIQTDRTFNVKKISKPFTFFHQGVEFCCGMVMNHENTHLILSVGVEDREAYLCHLKLETVQASLEELP